MNHSSTAATQWPSVSQATAPLVSDLIASADSLRLHVHTTDAGPCVVDAGIDCAGSLEAGRRIAEICLGAQGTVTFQAPPDLPDWPLGVAVHASDPVLGCMASQYAGWSLKHKDDSGKTVFDALGSGPARALAAREDLLKELGYRDRADEACLVIEADERPPEPLLLKIAERCGVEPTRLTVIVTPTASLAGSVQVSARVLEVALHKVHELGFPLADVVDGFGVAPVAPAGGGFVDAMGRTNDAVIYGGRVQLFVRGDEERTVRLCRDLPSHHSADFGKPFAETLKAYDFDFYQIDGSLFSPAKVTVSSLESGRSYTAGALDPSALARSFQGGGEA